MALLDRFILIQKWNRHVFVLTPNKLYYTEEQEKPHDDDEEDDEGNEEKQNRLEVRRFHGFLDKLTSLNSTVIRPLLPSEFHFLMTF